MIIPKPPLADVPEYFHNYFNLAIGNNLIPSLTENQHRVNIFFSAIIPTKESFACANGKWTIKQLLLHIIDSERVFAYRALRFARLDATNLAGFDENNYAQIATGNDRNLASIITEFNTVRNATISLYNTMTPQMLNFKGLANNNVVTANALGWLIIGHCEHHINCINERYL
jgi:hypothetical protein